MEQLPRAMAQLAEAQQHQMKLQQQQWEVINQHEHTRERTSTVPQVILKPNKEDDFEDYHQAFKKVIHTSQIDSKDWLIQLIPLLMGKNLMAYNEVVDDADYK